MPTLPGQKGGTLGQGTRPAYLTNDLMMFAPSAGMAMDDIARDTGNSTDPWAVLGNRWHPDAVDMPMATGNLSGPKPLPAVNQQTLANVVANQPRLPTSGYRPGQTAGDTTPFPQFQAPTPPAQHSPTLPAQANPRARLATAVMGATGMRRPQSGALRRPMFGNTRFGRSVTPRPFGG